MRYIASGIVGGLIVVAVLAGCWYWTTTPQYMLWAIDRAVRTGDPGTFDRHVDLDSIITSGVQAAIDAKSRESGLPLGTLLSQFPGAPLGNIAGGLARERVRTQILEGHDPAGGLTVHDVAFAHGQITETNETNARARIPIHAPGKDVIYEAEVKLVRTGDVWRITEVLNPEALLPLVEDYLDGFNPLRPR